MKSPHQSQVSKQAAQQSIDRKLEILRKWLEEGIPYKVDDSGHTLLDENDRKVLEYFPSSSRQFKLWDGSQNTPKLRASFPPLTVTGNDTLSKRKDSAAQVAKITEDLKDRAKSQLSEGRLSRIRELEQDLSILNKALNNRIVELRDQQRTLRNVEQEKIKMESKYNGDIEELQRQLQRTEAQLGEARQRNAELTALLKKITPMR